MVQAASKQTRRVDTQFAEDEKQALMQQLNDFKEHCAAQCEAFKKQSTQVHNAAALPVTLLLHHSAASLWCVTLLLHHSGAA